MSVMVNTSRSADARPDEALFNGYGNAAVATMHLPEHKNAVGAAVLTEGSTVLEKMGVATRLVGNLFFHFRAAESQTGDFTGAAWISNGPVCDKSADPNSSAPVIDWLVRYGWKSVNVKKRNDGSLGSFAIDPAPTPTGNFVKLFEGKMAEEQIAMFFQEPKIFYGPLFSQIQILTKTIGMIRDAKIYIRPMEHDELVVKWENVYTADANDETLWVQDSRGNLVTRIDIYETDDIKGSFRIPLKPYEVYTVSVPGYSYRNYSLTFNDSSTWLLEPVKLQFMGFLAENAQFYFKVMPGEQAYFCMKDYNRGAVEGPYGATLHRLDDDKIIDVVLDQQTYYYEHQKVPLPVEQQEQSYRVQLKGRGRAAFWLDGIPNLFTDRLSWYNRIIPDNNEILLNFPETTPQNYKGHIPLVGHYMPYAEIPANAKTLLESLKAQTANIYTFCDVMNRDPNWENKFKEYMSQGLKLERDYTILAKSGRIAVMDFENDPIVRSGVDAWIRNIARINDGKEHFIAAADEPNLNYPDYETYEKHFVAFARYVKAHPLTAQAKIKVVSPASSRFDHGTTVDDSYSRKGYNWAWKIVNLYPDLVDAIVWHDWTVRGLLNLRQYQTAIEKAWSLQGGRRKLAIEQTNTSGGQSVSLYDQNTEFATVWWSSVFINCARTGKLDDLMWFPIADEIDHPKGLLFTNYQTGEFSMKIVGEFHKWLMKWVYGSTNSRVYEMLQPHIEVDVVNWKDTEAGVDRDLTMGVNKSPRQYTIHFASHTLNHAKDYIEFFHPNGTSSVVAPQYEEGNLKLVVPANTVFMIRRGT